MKTKQEQIEEMAVIGCVRNPQAHTAEECAKCDFKYGQCNAYRHAEALYSVVISREEYEMLANKYKNLEIKYSNLFDKYRLCKDANETLKQNVITARKETAEAICNADHCKVDDYTIGFATYLMQKRRDEVDRLQSEIKRLKKENAFLLKACEEKFTFNTTQNKKYSVFNTVRKVFADEVKAKLLAVFGKTICSDLDTEDITDIIDELLKEHENEQR